MSLRALVRDQPERALALVGEAHVLVLRHAAQGSPRCIADFSTSSSFDPSGFTSLRPGGVHGTLGLINIEEDIFVCLITAASDRAEVRTGEIVKRILDVEFYGLSRGDFDRDLHRDPYYEDPDDVLTSNYDYTPGQDRREAIVHPCQALKKLLGDGSFYYSLSFDLTNGLQRRAAAESRFDIDSLDRAYLWNSYMIEPLIDFRSRLASSERTALDASQIITTAIRGYVESYSIPASRSPLRNLASSKPSRLLLISRLSCKRAGTRFNARGIDDDGNVANFVETESLFWHPTGLCFSYVQVRGSVPIFWEQTAGLVPQQQRIQITRSQEATQPAFDRHFDELDHKYGAVQVLNLLAERKVGEDTLTRLYHEHIRVRRHSRGSHLLGATHYDFHSETSGAEGYMAANAIRNELHERAESMAYFLADRVQEGHVSVVLQQQGVFRINCLDCLDRTNLVQTILSEKALEIFLEHRGERANSDLSTMHGTLWANNGDALSKIYAGTGALKSSFTRHGKMSLAGAIADARKSVKRLYVNNFQDTARQNVIDTLLGRLVSQSAVYLYDPVGEYIKIELEKRLPEYTSSSQITLWTGTFNLNGRRPADSSSLNDWLRPKGPEGGPDADIFVVAFQEIVELSPQQIMSTDPAHLRDWERKIAEKLNSRHLAGRSDYVQLRSGQLVGAALIVYVKSSLLPLIKNVEGTNKKTGMSGIAGNKGAVAIRMDISNTRVCFVTSHLAAGHSNTEDRNRDYRTIADGLRFPRRRTIDDHDVVIWLGDFNYRINGENDQVRRLVKTNDLETLYRLDQLNQAMSNASAFPYYSEGTINFAPTYKYDNGTDDYDTSEKQRIPAWCDRILFKGKGLLQVSYNAANLHFSDHRPVYASFVCTVTVVNEGLKERLTRDLYAHRRASQGASPDNIAEKGISDDWSNVEAPPLGAEGAFEPISKRRWWLRDGLAARSDLSEAEQYTSVIPGRSRPSNPFTPSDEPEWVNVGMHTSIHDRVPVGVSDSMPTGKNDRVHAVRYDDAAPKRKPAPIVPRKPATLSTSQEPHRRVIDHESESSLLHELSERPQLPPRPQTEVISSAQAGLRTETDDLLMVDEHESLSNIPSLVPHRSHH